MMRHIWNIFARAGSIWETWIKENIQKRRSFWRIGISQNSSWSWRKILRLREAARDFIKFEVGDGKNIHMWLDNWHPAGILLEEYSFMVIMLTVALMESCRRF